MGVVGLRMGLGWRDIRLVEGRRDWRGVLGSVGKGFRVGES